ncbi:MAG: hypothetical protein H6673_11020 [Anaerolineales bacterium]|nr:hypothetical protein [Anaerolineales bacterium]
MLKRLSIIIARLLIGAIIAYPFYWINDVLQIQNQWTWMLGVAVVLTLIERPLWQRLPKVPDYVLRVLIFGAIALTPLLIYSDSANANTAIAALYAGTILVLLAISLVYDQPLWGLKLGMMAFGVMVAIGMAEFAAGPILEARKEADAPKPPVVRRDDPTEEPAATVEPSATLENLPTATPEPTPTPDAGPPKLAGGGATFPVDNGQAPWSHYTGYGPRVNSTMHVWLYTADGQEVFDNMVDFNSKGSRGPEIDYEKPDNVYRILIIGDSFVEAVQVDYEQTFYALLQAELDQYSTPERRYEVVNMGRTGWGTLQEYIYYDKEGYKYDADLVISMFYINDVSDNYPRFFWPGINNTNYEYLFEGDTVTLVDTNQQPLPPNRSRTLYNALSEPLQKTNLAKLFVYLGDPPQQIRTPGGVMERVHPQFYIYVTEPEPEGYAEGWTRTAKGLELFANRVNGQGADYAVVSIFIGQEMIQSVAGWFPELTDGWGWDPDLPDHKLADILDGLPADLIRTRPAYEAYAEAAGGRVYDLMFIQEDGHFNATGHEVTKDILFDYLVEKSIVTP